ncbi:MAG TPA: hypothetical protein VMU78_05995 [Methylocella sp.]|nr:hypothetical protein [Methylocella sp.]
MAAACLLKSPSHASKPAGSRQVAASTGANQRRQKLNNYRLTPVGSCYADFKGKVKSSMHSLQRNTKKIRSFFEKDTLKYAA